MIKSFRHKGLELFFRSGTTKGIQAAHANKLRTQLSALNVAKGSQDMAIPSWSLHELSGKMKGQWSISVNGNWRMTFKFDEDGDAILVDYQDYH
jgi:proteic killer suppression protein